MKPICLCFLLSSVAAAAPVVSAVVNAASYSIPGMPNYGIAQGSIFVVFGTELASAAGGEMPSIRIAVAGTTLEATAILASPGQVLVILPASAPAGEATLTVSSGGQTSAPVSFLTVRNAFGIFSRNQAGSGPGIVQNFRSPSDQPLNTFLDAAQPGQVVTLWGTGLGVAPEQGPVDVLTGSKFANVKYAGRSGCCAGLDQIIFEVPPDVELGCYVPIVVRAGGMISNFVTLSVSATGGSCADPGGLSAKDLELIHSGRNAGFGSLVLNSDVDRRWFYPDDSVQYLSAGFFRENPLRPLGPLAGAPPAGTCVVYTIPGNATLLRPDRLANDPVRLTALDAGPELRLFGSSGARDIARGPNGAYYSIAPLPPGSYTLENTTPLRRAGGADIGAFSVSVGVPAPPAWNESDFLPSNDSSCPAGPMWDDELCFIERSKGVTVTWNRADPSLPVTIQGQKELMSGTARQPRTLATTSFLCTEQAGAGKFTVPPIVLMSLPPGPPLGFWDPSRLSVGHRSFAPFAASGLEVGYVVNQVSRSVEVHYQ